MWIKTPLILGAASLLVTVAHATHPSTGGADAPAVVPAPGAGQGQGHVPVQGAVEGKGKDDGEDKGEGKGKGKGGPPEQNPSHDDFTHQPPGGGAYYRRDHANARPFGQPAPGTALEKGNGEAKGHSAQQPQDPANDDFTHIPPGGGVFFRRPGDSDRKETRDAERSGAVSNVLAQRPATAATLPHQEFIDQAAQEEEGKGRPIQRPNQDNWSHMPPGGGAMY